MDLEANKSFIIECLIHYYTSTTCNTNYPQNKERKRVKLLLSAMPLQQVIQEIVTQCGIREEAQKRGLGSSLETKIARLHKTKEGPKAFSIYRKTS